VEKKWRASVEAAFENIKGKRLAQASQAVATLLNDMTTQLTQQSADSSVSTTDLMRAVKASLAVYVSKAEGPTKWPKLVEHLQTALAVIVKRVEGDAARGVEAAQRAATELKAELATAQGEVARLRAAAGSEESKARALEAQLEAAHLKAATDADRLRTQLQVCSAFVPTGRPRSQTKHCFYKQNYQQQNHHSGCLNESLRNHLMFLGDRMNVLQN
jgi:cell division septum initiation protein DivIVA